MRKKIIDDYSTPLDILKEVDDINDIVDTCFVILSTSIFLFDNTVLSVSSNLNGSQQISMMLLILKIGLHL